MKRAWIIAAAPVVIAAGLWLCLRPKPRTAAAPRRAAPSESAPVALAASPESVPDAPKSPPQPATNVAARPAASNPPAAPTYDAEALQRLFANALSNPNPDDRRLLIRGVAEFLAKNDPAKALDYLRAILALKDRSIDGDAYSFTQEFSSVLSARDPKALARWSDDIPERLKEVSYQFLARNWAASDPAAAAAWIPSVESPALRATAIRAMSQQLETEDPGGFGAQWAAGLARSLDGPRFSDLIVRLWAKSDPAAAASWIATLPSDDQDRGWIAFAGTLAEKSPESALAWSKRLPSGEVRERTLHETVSKWAAQDPAAVAAWLARDTSMPGLLERSVPVIAASWMRTDPVAATRWLEHAPIDPHLKDYFLSVGAPPGGRAR